MKVFCLFISIEVIQKNAKSQNEIANNTFRFEEFEAVVPTIKLRRRTCLSRLVAALTWLMSIISGHYLTAGGR